MAVRHKDGDYEHVERALRDAGLSPAHEDDVWSVYERQGWPAAVGRVVGLKATAPGVAQPDEFDQVCQQIATESRARAMAAGGDKTQALAYLQSVLAQLTGLTTNPGDGRLGDSEKATKATRPREALPDGLSAYLQRTGGIS